MNTDTSGKAGDDHVVLHDPASPLADMSASVEALLAGGGMLYLSQSPSVGLLNLPRQQYDFPVYEPTRLEP